MVESSAPPVWASIILEYHVVAAYFLAFWFPVWRWAHRCYKVEQGQPRMTVGIAFHQSATGFVLPSFVLLLGAFGYQPLVTHLGPHELGMAGLIGVITGLRELMVPE